MLLGAASMAAWAAGPLQIDVDEDNAPFMFARAGKAAGIYPAILEAAFRHMNVPVQVEALPWKRAIQDIDAGTAGVGGIYKNAEREKKYDYSEPIFAEKLMVFFNREHPVGFAKVDDLKGKRVGVIRGWSYGDAFDNARKANLFTVEETASDAQNFQKLAQGHLDVAVAIQESGAALMTKDKNIVITATPLSQNPTYLTFAKSASQTAVLKAFDQAIKDMKKSGELRKLVQDALAN
jgi:polar amino acid transport system substrate-binding protein